MSTAFKISERLFGSQLNLCGIVIPVCESTAARLFYFVGFILNLIMSLIAVNFGSSISNSVDDGECKSEDCFNRMAVLRICLSGFLFHFALGIVFVIMRYPSETRMAIQNEWWSVKAVIWGALFWFSTQLPLAVIQFFGRISLVGSGFAILMQSILLIDLAYYWNDIWIQTNRLKRLLIMSGILFLANLTLTIILFVYYTGPSCIENTFFITISLIEWLVFSALSIYGNRGVLPGTLMGFCCISLCFSAILSEPYRKNLHRCNRLGIDNSSFIALTLLSMNIAALGYCNVKIPTPKDISTETVQEDEEDEQTWNLHTERVEEVEAKKPISYSYRYFHLAYGMSYVFVAMVLTDWNLSVNKSDDNGSWTGAWSIMAAQWLSAVTFIWALLMPQFESPR